MLSTQKNLTNPPPNPVLSPSKANSNIPPTTSKASRWARKPCTPAPYKVRFGFVSMYIWRLWFALVPPHRMLIEHILICENKQVGKKASKEKLVLCSADPFNSWPHHLFPAKPCCFNVLCIVAGETLIPQTPSSWSWSLDKNKSGCRSIQPLKTMYIPSAVLRDVIKQLTPRLTIQNSRMSIKNSCLNYIACLIVKAANTWDHAWVESCLSTPTRWQWPSEVQAAWLQCRCISGSCQSRTTGNRIKPNNGNKQAQQDND